MSEIKVLEKMKHTFYVQLHFSENFALYDMKGKIMVETDRPQITTGRMRFVCWITKAADIHLEYVILIVFHGNGG